jgi:RNA polymerase sigma factor (TIGR02999 family)
MTSHQVTVLLQRLREGDRQALDELMPLAYGELRRIAQSFMRRQQPGHTLQPTALVNEAFIKLFQDTEPDIADRAHFLALMSRVMRQILIDHVRARGTAKRGGGESRVTWDTNIEVTGGRDSEHIKLLDLHRALEALARENAPLAQVLEMHYFGGMTAEEVSVVLARSVHTVRHDLRLARAWLRRELVRGPGAREETTTNLKRLIGLSRHDPRAGQAILNAARRVDDGDDGAGEENQKAKRYQKEGMRSASNSAAG